MKKLFVKSLIYIVLILITLEVFVRVFHLYKEVPVRYIDELGVEKSFPNQSGYSVTGNRNQNFSEYHINKFGFNSYREFTPTEKKVEIALIGDSFIEGMHQNYYNSIGQKIENNLKDIEVYEYGYAGYDLANQLYLVNAYKEHFKLIDHIIFYLKYENDLQNPAYIPNHDRIALLKSPLFKLRDNFKLLSYASDMGAIDPIKNIAIKLINKDKNDSERSKATQDKLDLKYLENFKTLTTTFEFDTTKMSFLLDSKSTSPLFLDYCKNNGITIIDFATAFENSKKPPTLIYDMHWNNHGRDIIAGLISDYIKSN